VVAVTFGFADPQFADQAAAGQWLAHERLLWGSNHIASQYKSDHGILAFTLITIKLVIFHVKVTWLPCTRLPRFLAQLYRSALCRLPPSCAPLSAGREATAVFEIGGSR
jgi:hypothetical protein